MPSVIVNQGNTQAADPNDLDEDLDLDDDDIDYKAENAALKQRINKMSDVYFSVKSRAEEAEKKNKEYKQKLDTALAQLQKYQEKEKKVSYVKKNCVAKDIFFNFEITCSILGGKRIRNCAAIDRSDISDNKIAR